MPSRLMPVGHPRRLNHPRRQQYRRVSRCAEAGIGAAICALLAIEAAGAGAMLVAAGLIIATLVLGLSARHWLQLAHRSHVGARSEDAVQRALAPLQADGWRLRHSLSWGGRGDIDSLAVAPSGIAVVIETKTRSYDRGHVARVHQQATWLSRSRRRWAPDGAIAVICLVNARGVERVEDDVLVVSIDRLTRILRVAASMQPARQG